MSESENNEETSIEIEYLLDMKRNKKSGLKIKTCDKISEKLLYFLIFVNKLMQNLLDLRLIDTNDREIWACQ